MEFNHTEEKVLGEIDKIKSGLTGLANNGSYQATSTGPLIKGCKICTQMRSMTFVLGYRCNANCDFCFVDSYVSDDYEEDEKYNRMACFDDFCRNKDKIDGTGFTGGETLLYLEELNEYASKIKKEKPSMYFWIYTNGIDADHNNLSILKDIGISEIRFNLAASGYSKNVIDKLKLARDLFEYVAVEVPAYPRQEQKLFDSLDSFENCGIDQLNMQELMITGNNISKLAGEGYQSGVMFLKKYFLYGSRKLTYKVMKYCIDKDYSFTVNDCSARKFGRLEPV